MPIELQNPEEISRDVLAARIQRYIESIIATFKRIGEDAVKVARLTHKYKDQTGNLTSSIGYGIVDDGSIIFQSSFDVVKSGANGAAEGKAYLRQLASENNQGIVLIIVAGKNYAKFVEAKGLNVLAGATIQADAMAKKALKMLKV